MWGHDHDQCTVSHRIPRTGAEAAAAERGGRTVEEHTVGTFSWLMGNARPSFMLITLAGEGGGGEQDNTTVRSAVATQLCYLPNQLWTFEYCYAYLGALTAALLLLLPLARGVLGHGARAHQGMRKDKVEDDDHPDDYPDDYPGDDGEGVRVQYEYTGSGGGGAGPLGSSAKAPKVFFAAGAGAGAAAGRTPWRRAARVLWLGLPDRYRSPRHRHAFSTLAS